jgi:glycosyltransferase involved in cell wall biosynthesis
MISRISTKPLISIVTVSFNSEKTIRNTFESVLNQSYNSIEYIVIDGLSNDNTINIIKEYQDKFPKRNITFKWKSEKDSGIYDAMNKGIKLSTGDYIGILNSDDWYCPNILELMAISMIQMPDVDLFHGNIIEITPTISKIIYPKTSMNSLIWVGMTYLHPSFFVKRGVYDVIIFDDNYKIAADYKFLMQAILGNFKLHYINRPITYMSPGGISEKFIPRILEGHNIRIDLNFNKFVVYSSTIVRIFRTFTSKCKTYLIKFKIID